MENTLTLRTAEPEEAKILSELAMRSKSYWGYSDDFMNACKAELTVTSEKIQDSKFHLVVAESAGEIIGFYGVERLSPLQFELEALFVNPRDMGLGIGRALIDHAKNFIAASGGGTLLIQGDPNAEEFYRAVGAQPIGEKESASIPGRFLPMLLIKIDKDEDVRAASSEPESLDLKPQPNSSTAVTGIPIDSDRLQIRQFTQEDVEPFTSFMTDQASTRFLAFGDEQKSHEGARQLLEATISSYETEHPMLAFAVEELTTGTFVGFCGLTPHDEETVEIMYAVMPHARQKGYATKIATTLSQYAFDRLGYRRVVAPIAPANEPSKIVANKAGFKDHGLLPNAESAEVVHQFVLERGVQKQD